MRSESRGKQAVAAERDEFAVDRQAVRQGGERGGEAAHVPAAPTLDAELADAVDERAEAIPLRLKGIVAARSASGRRPATELLDVARTGGARWLAGARAWLRPRWVTLPAAGKGAFGTARAGRIRRSPVECLMTVWLGNVR